MSSNQAIFESIWFPFTFHEDIIEYPPRIIEKGEGIYLYDSQGKRYIDAIASWWVNILGHNRKEINEAIHLQIENLEHVLMTGFISPATMSCAQLLKEILPRSFIKLFFSDNGSTAVEVALKMALQYWYLKGRKKNKFVALGGAYHGDTFGAMSVGGIPTYHQLFHGFVSTQLFTDPPNCFRCPRRQDKETCRAECMDSLERILADESEYIAACIFEPMVQAASGMRMYPVKVLQRIFSLCRHYGVLTIADEVAMGFGRTGKRFACEHAGLYPDIMCLAKGLSGGYLPMAVTAVQGFIYDEFMGAFPSERILYHGHSFTGNPIASAAAAATLRIIISQNIPESLSSLIRHFHDGIRRFEEAPLVGEARSLGMIGALELTAEKTTKEPLPPERRIPFKLCRAALDLGLLIRPLGDVLYFIPAYCITPQQIDAMFDITQRCLHKMYNDERTYL